MLRGISLPIPFLSLLLPFLVVTATVDLDLHLGLLVLQGISKEKKRHQWRFCSFWIPARGKGKSIFCSCCHFKCFLQKTLGVSAANDPKLKVSVIEATTTCKYEENISPVLSQSYTSAASSMCIWKAGMGILASLPKAKTKEAPAISLRILSSVDCHKHYH